MEPNSTDLPFLKGVLQLKKQFDAPNLESLPESYKSNSEVEKLYLWSAENFRRQIRQQFPHLQPKFLTSSNECQVEKLIMTFIKVCVCLCVLVNHSFYVLIRITDTVRLSANSATICPSL